MFAPYSYQAECLTQLAKARSQGLAKALVVMASGLGKTITVSLDVQQWLQISPSSRVLYLCHQNDILSQLRVTLEVMLGGSSKLYGYYHGQAKEVNAKILFASFRTMRTHLQDFAPDAFDYIVVDESHHASAETFEPIVAYFTPKFLIGLTATPDRHDLKDIRRVFGEEVFSLDLPQALAKGLLTSVDYRLVTDEFVQLSEIENPYGMSFGELNRRVFIPKRDEEIARIIQEKTAGMSDSKMMIFCSSTAHAERMHPFFERSMSVHSGMPIGEQGVRIDAFKKGLVRTILTVDKFNEGVDIPEVNIIVFLRSTESQTVLYQQLGRGLRRVKGKETVLVLDFAGNCDRIQLVRGLVREIEEAKREMAKSETSNGTTSGVTVDFGHFNFTETARDILAILDKIEQGYTKDVLIAQLQAEAKLLGRRPKYEDIAISSREGRTANYNTFLHFFGSLGDALDAAGLVPAVTKPPRIRKPPMGPAIRYDRDRLIQQLQDEGKYLGRTPAKRDIEKAGKEGRTASYGPFYEIFGSWNAAVQAAGFAVNRTIGDLPFKVLGEGERRKRKGR